MQGHSRTGKHVPDSTIHRREAGIDARSRHSTEHVVVCWGITMSLDLYRIFSHGSNLHAFMDFHLQNDRIWVHFGLEVLDIVILTPYSSNRERQSHAYLQLSLIIWN